MLQSEFIVLKEGDQVIYNDSLGFQTCDKGLVLTRQFGWLDDHSTAQFKFTTANGTNDYHFFSSEELDLIKE